MIRFLRLVPLFLVVTLVGACSTVQQYGSVAIEKRRQMNDMQARATMAATCDIALGSFFRELSPTERKYVTLVCGGQDPTAADFPLEPAKAPAE